MAMKNKATILLAVLAVGVRRVPTQRKESHSRREGAVLARQAITLEAVGG